MRFFARGEADDGGGDGDNGLRVTLHLVNVEYAVCGSRAGGAIEVFDLRVSPPVLLDDIDDIGNERLRTRLQDIVLSFWCFKGTPGGHDRPSSGNRRRLAMSGRPAASAKDSLNRRPRPGRRAGAGS